MSILVIAEHDQNHLKPATLNTVTAARKLDSDVHVVVMGHNVGAVAAQAAAVSGVARVLHADSVEFAAHLPENLCPALMAIVDKYSHVIAPATTFGKNVLPRLAALKDVAQISEVIEIVGRRDIPPSSLRGKCDCNGSVKRDSKTVDGSAVGV
jgi:electron transfer flavoprotein alpha subunit